MLVTLGITGENAAAIIAGACALGLLAFWAPVSRWGPVGLLLTFGLLVTIAGTAVWAVGDFGETAVEELNADNDGDGRTDEDPLGDADNSRQDPTKVDGTQEIQRPADDDSDGQTDEDPPAPLGASTASKTLRSWGPIVTGAGALMVLIFAIFANRRAKKAPAGGPAPPPAPLLTLTPNERAKRDSNP